MDEPSIVEEKRLRGGGTRYGRRTYLENVNQRILFPVISKFQKKYSTDSVMRKFLPRDNVVLETMMISKYGGMLTDNKIKTTTYRMSSQFPTVNRSHD